MLKMYTSSEQPHDTQLHDRKEGVVREEDQGNENGEEEEAMEDNNVELEDLALEDASLAMSNIVGGPGGEG